MIMAFTLKAEQLVATNLISDVYGVAGFKLTWRG